MMRGGDAEHLTLTRRQIAKIEAAAAGRISDGLVVAGAMPPVAADTAEADMRALIAHFRNRAPLHRSIDVDGGGTLTDLFADDMRLMNYLKTAVAKGDEAGPVEGQPLVVPGDPDASAFVRLLRRPDHPMSGPVLARGPQYRGTHGTGNRRTLDPLTAGGLSPPTHHTMRGTDMPSIEPKNVTAQILHRARGNPPSTTDTPPYRTASPDSSSISAASCGTSSSASCFTSCSPSSSGSNQAGRRSSPAAGLASGRGRRQSTFGTIMGPRQANGPSEHLGVFGLERFNALAPIFRSAGQRVRCVFLNIQSNQQLEFNLEVRSILERRTNSTGQQETGPALSKDIAAPGDLTQGLCSPWSADFLECGCYYWAASRPDLVNAQAGADGKVDGHNWLHRDRAAATPPQYSIRSNDLVTYEDLYRDWEGSLKFIVGGRDES